MLILKLVGLASLRLPWAALAGADDGFNVVPRRVELLFRE